MRRECITCIRGTSNILNGCFDIFRAHLRGVESNFCAVGPGKTVISDFCVGINGTTTTLWCSSTLRKHHEKLLTKWGQWVWRVWISRRASWRSIWEHVLVWRALDDFRTQQVVISYRIVVCVGKKNALMKRFWEYFVSKLDKHLCDYCCATSSVLNLALRKSYPCPPIAKEWI